MNIGSRPPQTAVPPFQNACVLVIRRDITADDSGTCAIVFHRKPAKLCAAMTIVHDFVVDLRLADCFRLIPKVSTTIDRLLTCVT